MASESVEVKPKVVTEDLGHIFEMAICLLYGIEYDGKFKYSIDEANKIKDKLQKLKEVFPYNIKHVAGNGNKYDFESVDDQTIHLSAKSIKAKGIAKVCPQVIGQPSKKRFCEAFGLEQSISLEEIKSHIEKNLMQMLEEYCSNTFDCPVVYYNKPKNILLFIRLKEKINWNDYTYTFSHNVKNKKWNESSTVSIGKVNIGEFQVHNHRDSIKFRWAFDNVLSMFKDNFEIVSL
jgi:hypothetical protein